MQAVFLRFLGLRRCVAASSYVAALFPCGIMPVPMSKAKSPGDLSEQELRRLLLDKRRVSRRERLERFRRTGRVVALEPDIPVEAGNGQPGMVSEAAAASGSGSKRGRRWLDGLLLAVEVLAVIG